MACSVSKNSNFDCLAKSETTPAKFSKILSDRINFIIRKIQKFIKNTRKLAVYHAKLGWL